MGAAGAAAAHLQAPERASLREILDDLWSQSGVDLTPLRRLVAALVQSSGRHTQHGMKAPVLGKHPCARGKAGHATCRYGHPHEHLQRGGPRGMRLEKGEREGQWFARFPRNDALCCNYEACPALHLNPSTNTDPTQSLRCLYMLVSAGSRGSAPALGARLSRFVR